MKLNHINELILAHVPHILHLLPFLFVIVHACPMYMLIACVCVCVGGGRLCLIFLSGPLLQTLSMSHNCITTQPQIMTGSIPLPLPCVYVCVRWWAAVYRDARNGRHVCKKGLTVLCKPSCFGHVCILCKLDHCFLSCSSCLILA